MPAGAGRCVSKAWCRLNSPSPHPQEQDHQPPQMISKIGAPLQVPANACFQGVAPEQADAPARPLKAYPASSARNGPRSHSCAGKSKPTFFRRSVDSRQLALHQFPQHDLLRACRALSDGPAARRRTPRCGGPETAAALRWSAPCSCGPPSPGCRREDSSAGRTTDRPSRLLRSRRKLAQQFGQRGGQRRRGQRMPSPRRRTRRSSRRGRAPAGIRQPSSEALQHVLEADLLVRYRQPAAPWRGRRARAHAGSRRTSRASWSAR